MICGQTRVPGVSVSQVARRYDVNANQVFKWLREARFSDALPPEAESSCFLPVELVEDATVVHCVDGEPARSCSGGRLEIDLAGGHRLRVIGVYDPETLAQFVRRLS